MNMNRQNLLNLFIALVWLINGLFCKVLNLVPRHQEIVARILGETYSRQLTLIIGILEIGMVIWFLSGIAKRLNAVTQIVIVALMNIIEFFFASDLLLWGKFNAVFASIFILIVYFNEFNSDKRLK